MLSEIFSKEKLLSTINHFGNQNSVGIDGMTMKDVFSYVELNYDIIIDSIITNTYQVSPIEEFEILNKKQKIRKVTRMGNLDKCIAKILQEKLEEILENEHHQNSFAYQKNKGVSSAITMAKHYIQDGNEIVVNLDFIDYFGSIDHTILINLLKEYEETIELIPMLEKLIGCGIYRDHRIFTLTKGIIQGSPLSPILSNLYLFAFDSYLDQNQLQFTRYADDIKIYCSNSEQAQSVYINCRDYLFNQLKLSLNEAKSGVFQFDQKDYLGYKFQKTINGIEAFHPQNKLFTFFQEWNKEALTLQNNTYYILEDGILTKKDYSILFESIDQKQNIPINVVEQLNIYSNIVFSSKFFDFLNQKNVEVNFFDTYNQMIGTFIPYHCQSDISLLIKQVEIYADPKRRLYYAKRIILTSAHNILVNMKYYARRYPNEKWETKLEKSISMMDKINQVKTIEDLLLNEAQFRQLYYETFPFIIRNPVFYYEKRSRRPPKDPLNALISFGNTFLYNLICAYIHRSRLDSRISFVHASKSKRENLCLDLAEIYKPIIIDRAIFSVINKKMLDPNLHFEKQKNGIYLNKEGKRIFIQTIRKKLIQKIAFQQCQKTYLSIIHTDINKLKKAIETGSELKLYKGK